ncbi:MAG: hypothetical protein J7498_06205 [Sphingobium sp.]|nr:hypothetical protein [Sphingobium sp.]
MTAIAIDSRVAGASQIRNPIGRILAAALLLAMILNVPILYPWLPLLAALVVAHQAGLRLGLITLVALSLPLGWHDGLWHPAVALGAFFSVHIGRRRHLMATEATALYGLLATALFALFYVMTGPISSGALALAAFRELMRAVLLAAIADLLNSNFMLRRHWPFVAIDPQPSILETVRAGSSLLIIIFVAIPATSQIAALTGLERDYRTQIDKAALARIAPLVADGQSEGSGRFRVVAQPRDAEFYFHRTGTAMSHALSDQVDAACLPAGAPHAESAMAPCTQFHATAAGRSVEVSVVYAEFDRGLLPRHYGELLLLLTGALLAWFFRSMLSRTLRDTFVQANIVIDRFGNHELPEPPGPTIREMDEPLRRLVALNNMSVALRTERERLAEVAADLHRSIGLKLMRDVTFDAERGVLRYTEVRLVAEPAQAQIQVHPEDCARFRVAAGLAETVIEFRSATSTEFECLLITLHDSIGGMGWGSGVMVQLNQPRHLDDIMAKQARLADLGNVASSIGHEIKQPLFTIAVAAESLRLLATKGQSGLIDPQILGRIDRISEQVGRARDIIEHVTRYGKASNAEPVAIDVTETMRRALSFLTPAIEDQGIDVNMAIDEGPLWALMSQVELEQVFVNALQNAIDAIVTRRSAGWTGQGAIDLRVMSAGATIACAVGDNGLGLAPSIAQSAFSAFFTTKADKGTGLGLYISRQIVTRAGGHITLRQADDSGAVLEIELPAVPSPAQG